MGIQHVDDHVCKGKDDRVPYDQIPHGVEKVYPGFRHVADGSVKGRCHVRMATTAAAVTHPSIVPRSHTQPNRNTNSLAHACLLSRTHTQGSPNVHIDIHQLLRRACTPVHPHQMSDCFCHGVFPRIFPKSTGSTQYLRVKCGKLTSEVILVCVRQFKNRIIFVFRKQ